MACHNRPDPSMRKPDFPLLSPECGGLSLTEGLRRKQAPFEKERVRDEDDEF